MLRFAKLKPFLLAGIALVACSGVSRAQTQIAEATPLQKVIVTGHPELSSLIEEQSVGDYGQPSWTTRRRFAGTRAYVLPTWDVELETWYRGDLSEHERAKNLFQQEIGVGLPHRFQLDFYTNFLDDRSGTVKCDGAQYEARWAFADWGKIFLNPTIYAEWRQRERDPNKYEFKLLLSEQLASRWHWALNLIYEQEDSGTRETEWGWSQGLSYSLLDEKLSLGVEMKFGHITEAGNRHDAAIEFFVGPSLQWRLTDRIHLDLVPLFGVTKDSGDAQVFIVFGFDLGAGGKILRPQMPAAHRGE